MPVAVSNTAYGIIRDAMVDAGLLGEDETPNSTQLANGMRRLCDVINVIQLGGIKLFLLKTIDITLVDGTYSYTVNPTVGLVPTKHLSVLNGSIVQPDTVRRPLLPMSYEEWLSRPQQTEGAITQYFADKQATSLDLYVWPTPDAEEALNTLQLEVRTQAENPYILTDNVSFPQEWRMALRWSLAADIATGQPDSVINRCEGKAAYFTELLENWDVEDAPTRFGLEITQAYQTGGFV